MPTKQYTVTHVVLPKNKLLPPRINQQYLKKDASAMLEKYTLKQKKNHFERKRRRPWSLDGAVQDPVAAESGEIFRFSPSFVALRA